MKKTDSVFKLTFEDIEGILGRDLTEDEMDLVYSKFNINSWAEEVEVFLDVFEIK
jgi:hypothetical protein